ncbi:heparan-alpha-glucosaminide N-acetyltransferase domain-containing protein [Nocardioides pantholopis]|uniref:heparan-alpha-glucosaminide N-acetyltransferase domain-containing protein n=1 Tax=Nocardioides pantholopis TaxID=2483798 RepID=UPI000F094123|nr:heparan-alpha-glucosaminide N-acetyltransferase domain-containing protein [Nocardioides pantholopis]
MARVPAATTRFGGRFEGRFEGRLVGLDVARCLALLGMVATHVLDPFGPDRELEPAQWLAGGRASALFAVLAGVTVALATGGRQRFAGRELGARCAGLAVRALLVALLGLALGVPDSGLAVILTYYGVLFLLALPFTALGPRALLALAGAWAVVVPVLSHLVRPELPERGWESPDPGQLAEPGRLLAELLLTGYYPALPWLAYLLVGMAVGRLDLRARTVQRVLLGAGLATAVLATVVSRLLVAWAATPTVEGETAAATAARLADAPAGLYGTTPTGGSWQWLLVAHPHSATTFDLAQTTGSAVAVIGGCLLLVGALGELPREALRVLAGAGTMTLTLYSLHVLLRTDALWPPDDAFHWHALVLLAIGALYAAVRRRGPLERAVGAAATAATRLVRGSPEVSPGTGRR